jgi:hypothetical protein
VTITSSWIVCGLSVFISCTPSLVSVLGVLY